MKNHYSEQRRRYMNHMNEWTGMNLHVTVTKIILWQSYVTSSLIIEIPISTHRRTHPVAESRKGIFIFRHCRSNISIMSEPSQKTGSSRLFIITWDCTRGTVYMSSHSISLHTPHQETKPTWRLSWLSPRAREVSPVVHESSLASVDPVSAESIVRESGGLCKWWQNAPHREAWNLHQLHRVLQEAVRIVFHRGYVTMGRLGEVSYGSNAVQYKKGAPLRPYMTKASKWVCDITH